MLHAAIDRLAEVVLGLLVIATVACGGPWLLVQLLDAGARLVPEWSWSVASTALAALASLAGLVGVAMLAFTWRDRCRGLPAGGVRHRRELHAIATLAALAAIVIATRTHPEAAPPYLQRPVDQAAALRTDWLPAICSGLIALSALCLLSTPRRRPAAPPVASDRGRFPPQLMHAAGHAIGRIGRRFRLARDPALAGLTWAAHRATSSAAIRQLPAGAKDEAPSRTLGSPRHVHLRRAAWLLMLVPVSGVLPPLALALAEYGGSVIALLGAAAFVMPPVLLALVVVLALSGLCAAGLVALVRLWWSLLDAHLAAPAWARLLTAVGIVLGVAAAWVLHGSAGHHALAWRLDIAGWPITPPIVAALDGLVLLTIDAASRDRPR